MRSRTFTALAERAVKPGLQWAAPVRILLW